jgi:hypoxanthine-guanine phosphoribosyltransferase
MVIGLKLYIFITTLRGSMFFMAQISIHISIFLMYNYYAITIFLPWILHIHKLCQNF